MIKISRILLPAVIIISMMTVSGFSQTPKQIFELDAAEPDTTRIYKAKLYVKLKKNFRFTAKSGKSFRAYIDPNLPISITTINNPSPNVVTNPQSDNTYTPGGTYSSDMPNGKTNIAFVGKDSTGIPILTYPALWFKTIPYTNNLNGYYYWKEVTGNKASMTIYASPGPGDVLLLTKPWVRSFNFNPALDFSACNVNNEIRIRETNLSQATFMGVWAPKQDYKTDQFVFAVHGRKNESMIFTKDTVGEPVGIREKFAYGTSNAQSLLFKDRGAQDKDSNLFKEKAPKIATVYRTFKPETGIWGESPNAIINIGGVFDTTKINQASVFSSSWQNYRAFKGYSPELLIFNRIINDDERNIFESYLAIKYGLTLHKSYVNDRNQVIWDYAANSAFNNRITAYAREDALGLCQKTSTTSYEEKPYFSTLATGDSYETYDSYKLSNANKLLVVGTQPGNGLVDGEYYIWGDNNDSIHKTDSLANGYKILKRRWKMLSNTNDVRPFSIFSWDISNLTRESTVSQYISNFVKLPSSSNGYARTSTPLSGKDGYLSWVVGLENGPIKIKFGASQDVFNNSFSYGYYLNANGDVRKIYRDSLYDYTLFTSERHQKIEIEKQGNLIYLRVNGVRYKETEMVMDSADTNRSYYGHVVFMANPAGDVRLNNFRYGGFSNTGNQVEISYKDGKASVFQPYIGSKNLYLFINRNGNNNFIPGATPDDIAIIACDEIDASRSKAIFNNVFWTNQSLFTFGYRIQGSSGIIKRPKQQDDESNPLNDIRIYYKNPRDLKHITVRIQTAEPSPASVYMFDISGRLVYRTNLLESNEIRLVEIELPDKGVYVVKVLTKDMKYTKKVISDR
jgi:hypothetical protein